MSTLPDESSTIDAYTTVDAQYSANFGITEENEVVLTLGVKNLLDELASRAYIAVGSLTYDPKQHNSLGRVIYAKIKFAF